MKLRDLTDKQRLRLVKASERLFKERNKGRVINNPFDEMSYLTGFSDGVRVIIERLKTLP